MNRCFILTVRSRAIAIFTVAVSIYAGAAVQAQPTAFTYQGVLRNNNAPINGSVDLQFRLFDAAVGGNQVGSTIAVNAVAVDSGLFTETLDFGTLVFNGDERWLEIAVASPAGGGAGPFTTLSPRQRITSAPYAVYALNASISGTQGGAVDFTNAANTFTGAFSGSGAGLTNLNPANLTTGTAGINITGNAATATTATTAGNVSGIVAVANGGTGANNAAGARTNLGAAATSHTHAAGDITTGNLAIARMPTGGTWSITSNLNIDANTLVIDQANDRVGIGLSAPLANLHVRGAGGLGALLITPTTSDTISQITLSENSSNTFGMIVRMDGAANQLHVLANSSGVEQSPVVSIDRSANPSVGIGTTEPEAPLHVFEGSAGTITAAASASLVLERAAANYLQILAPDASESGVLFGNPTNGINAAGVLFNSSGNANGLQFRTGTNTTRVTVSSAGIVTLHGGSDVSPTGGGYLVAGSTTGFNIALDNNEIMARNNGVPATLNLNLDGGDVSIAANGTGKLITPIIEITGADLAEEFPFSERAEPGMVVAIDPDHPGLLCVARGAYNPTVAGIIAGGNNFPTGAVLGRKSGGSTGLPVALSGRVYVRASDINGEIRPGDLLTTSDLPGVAMKATDPNRMTGAILGKAMTAIDPDTGFVLVLVNLH